MKLRNIFLIGYRFNPEKNSLHFVKGKLLNPKHCHIQANAIIFLQVNVGGAVVACYFDLVEDRGSIPFPATKKYFQVFVYFQEIFHIFAA